MEVQSLKDIHACLQSMYGVHRFMHYGIYYVDASCCIYMHILVLFKTRPCIHACLGATHERVQTRLKAGRV